MRLKTYLKNIYPRKIYHHVRKTKKISDQIIKLFNEKAYMYPDINPFTSDEITSIKYGCYLHDIGKLIYPQDHDSAGMTFFKEECWEILNDHLKRKNIPKKERKNIKHYISSAIGCHKEWSNNNEDLGNIYVSMVVFASDKISHMKKKNFDRYYRKAWRKIDTIMKIIKRQGLKNPKIDLLYSCITDVLKKMYRKKLRTN